MNMKLETILKWTAVIAGIGCGTYVASKAMDKGYNFSVSHKDTKAAFTKDGKKEPESK